MVAAWEGSHIEAVKHDIGSSSDLGLWEQNVERAPLSPRDPPGGSMLAC